MRPVFVGTSPEVTGGAECASLMSSRDTSNCGNWVCHRKRGRSVWYGSMCCTWILISVKYFWILCNLLKGSEACCDGISLLISVWSPVCSIHARSLEVEHVPDQTWSFLKSMPCPVCRSSSLQHQVKLGQRADDPDRPGVSSVSRFCECDWRVRTCKQGAAAAAAAGSGSDDEASWRKKTRQIRPGGRVQGAAETDEVLERPRTQCRGRRGRTLPALMEPMVWLGVRTPLMIAPLH